jgi:hypothetical protein
LGYGWSLSIPYIERLNKTGSENLYGDTPYFTSSAEGELASDATTSSATTPTILDTLDLTTHGYSSGTSDSFSVHTSNYESVVLHIGENSIVG